MLRGPWDGMQITWKSWLGRPTRLLCPQNRLYMPYTVAMTISTLSTYSKDFCMLGRNFPGPCFRGDSCMIQSTVRENPEPLLFGRFLSLLYITCPQPNFCLSLERKTFIAKWTSSMRVNEPDLCYRHLNAKSWSVSIKQHYGGLGHLLYQPSSCPNGVYSSIKDRQTITIKCDKGHEKYRA